jgi:hypothetical protein
MFWRPAGLSSRYLVVGCCYLRNVNWLGPGSTSWPTDHVCVSGEWCKRLEDACRGGGDLTKIVTASVEGRIAIDNCYTSSTFPILPDFPPNIANAAKATTERTKECYSCWLWPVSCWKSSSPAPSTSSSPAPRAQPQTG